MRTEEYDDFWEEVENDEEWDFIDKLYDEDSYWENEEYWNFINERFNDSIQKGENYIII